MYYILKINKIMKSIFAIAALCAVSTAKVTNELIYKQPRRLDTELVQFVDTEDIPESDAALLQTDSVKRPAHKENVGVRFIEQDDVKWNNELYKLNNITKLGDHGFLIKDWAPDYSGWTRNIHDPDAVKELVKVLRGEEDQAKAAEEADDPDKLAEAVANSMN